MRQWLTIRLHTRLILQEMQDVSKRSRKMNKRDKKSKKKKIKIQNLTNSTIIIEAIHKKSRMIELSLIISIMQDGMN